MAWTIEYDVAFRKTVEKLNPQDRKRIRDYLQERIAALDDPRLVGKALQGSKLGAFGCYRVGDFRIICDLPDHRLVVPVLQIGNRRQVYR